MTDTISVLMPSRGRPDSITRLANSASDTADHISHVEIIVRLDEDDPAAKDYKPIEGLVTYLVGPRILLSQYWNEAYDHASGDIIMHCADDITFNTPGWDTMVRDAFEQTHDKILLVHGDDLSPNGTTLATAGFIHRRWVEATGYLLVPLFSSNWNDVWLTEVADAVGRRRLLPFVTEHHHYGFGKAEHDLTYKEREARGEHDDVDELWQQTQGLRDADAEKLRAMMT